MNTGTGFRSADQRRLIAVYLASVVAAIAVVLAILWTGGNLLVPSRPPGSARRETVDVLFRVLLALMVVIATARLTGMLFRNLGQPPVTGEIVGGILLGPSLLGALSPAAYAALLPSEAAPFLGVVSQLGVVLYMFIVGLHMDLGVVRTTGRAALVISHASIVVPFVFGTALALTLHGLAGEHATFTSFALFMGVSLSVTAFPVLARILSDKGLQRTELGMLALTCAAVDDVTAWCLLAVVVSVSQATLHGALVTVASTVGYIAVMFLIVRPLAARGVGVLDRVERLNDDGLTLVFVALLASALATELIGIHALFGAFLLGAVIPHTSRVATDVTDRLEGLVRVMFLPAFFAFTGMRTQIGLLTSWQDWAICLLIVAVATAGKFGGTFVAARFAGLTRKKASTLGVLMNTRGLVELVVLNVGLEIGVISPRLFTMLVIMALVTTFATSPIVDALAVARDEASPRPLSDYSRVGRKY